MRTLAQTRLREAKGLLTLNEPSGAYYLAGYALECGLKAVITRGLTAYSLPEKDELQVFQSSFQHDLNRLVELAALGPALGAEIDANSSFRDYWLVAKDWKESSRYQVWTMRAALGIVEAVADSTNGVLRWIQLHW